MRKLEKVASRPGESEWELALGFVQLKLWPYRVEHEPGSRFDAHYHGSDEELQVTRGSMTFFEVGAASADGIELQAGERMKIPEGTVHSVTIGSEGVTYVMGLGRPTPLEQFSIPLPASRDVPLDVLAGLVEANYHIAEAEEEGEKAKSFFQDLLSDRFVFVGAVGDQSMRKAEFTGGLEGRKGRGRRSKGLRLRREGKALVASIVVATADGAEYLNTRLFERDPDGRWRCVRWSNAQAQAPNPAPRG